MVPRSHSHRSASLFQHRAAQIFVPVVRWRMMVAPVSMIRRIISRPCLSQRLSAQRAAARIDPARRPIDCGQPHSSGWPAAPHVRVSGHLMTCPSHTGHSLKMSALSSCSRALYTAPLWWLINERVLCREWSARNAHATPTHTQGRRCALTPRGWFREIPKGHFISLHDDYVQKLFVLPFYIFVVFK